MAVAQRDDTEIWWESTGEGPPVLLVMGLGMASTGWWRTIPTLAERFRVLSFDNRGVGRSGRPPGPYSIPQMAADAMAVLDAAGERSAHVYGASLGGMIALELALGHADRVDCLVLGCTTAGGALNVPADEGTLGFFVRRGQMPAEEGVWASVPYNYAPATRREHGDRIAADIVQRLRYPIEPEPYKAQLGAAMSHDISGRLGEIRAPTLVVHGDEDRMIPIENGRILAREIPGAQMLTLPGAAHLFITDDLGADRAIGDFLSAPTSPGPWSPGRP